MVKVFHGDKDITAIVTKTVWSGDYKQAARKISLGIAVAPHDPYLPVTSIRQGDVITVLYNGAEIFRGYVFFKEKSVDSNEMQITAYDGLIYFLKSKGTYNFKDTTPGAIANQLCDDFGIPKGSFITGSPLTRIFDGVEIYNILMTAYTMEYEKTDIPYMPRMIEGKLEVVRKGIHKATFVLDPGSNIINSSYSESMEDSVNKVKMYDKEGNSIGEVTLDESSGVVGILQDIYKQEEGEDATVKARKLLKEIDRTADIEALGEIDCITGNGVIVRESFTGLNGLFYIDSDEHEFVEGQHLMKLKLSYKNLMDEQMAGGEEKEDPAEGEFGLSDGSVQATANVSDSVLRYRPLVEKYAREFGVYEYVPLILALIQQESGGRYSDVMQSAECRYNTKYPKRQNGITDPDYSVWAGVQEFRDIIRKAGVTSPSDMDNIKLALQGYNFGPAWIDWAKARGGYSVANAKEFSRIWAAKMGWSRYGDVNYVNNVLRYYTVVIVNTGASSSSAGVGSKRQAFIRAAESFAGWPYSRKPKLRMTTHVDCSSLVGRAMVKSGLTTNPQVTTDSMTRDSRFYQVPLNQAQPGDCLWVKGHVAVLIAPDRLIEAADENQGVVYGRKRGGFTRCYRIKGIDG